MPSLAGWLTSRKIYELCVCYSSWKCQNTKKKALSQGIEKAQKWGVIQRRLSAVVKKVPAAEQQLSIFCQRKLLILPLSVRFFCCLYYFCDTHRRRREAAALFMSNFPAL